MEAHKLRFVRCPKCLQLLVEYPSIPVYQCGSCGTVLKAKNQVVPATHTDSESSEHNNFSSSLKGSPQNNKSICSDEQKTISPDAQPSGSAVEENIFSSRKNANQEITMSIGESAIPGVHENEEKISLVDGTVPNPEFMIKETNNTGTGADLSPKLMENVENVDMGECANVEKGYMMDQVDGSVGSEIVAIHSMACEEPQADSNNDMRREIDSVTEQKCSVSNKNVNCKEIVQRDKLTEETEAKSDMLIRREERLQPNESYCIESHEDLIEELERSLSFSDEEDFFDVTDSSGLNDALHYQIGSRRFSSGGKMNDASRSDPHGRLIEELERSFSDTEEPLEQHLVVADKEIPEKVHRDEHGNDPKSLDAKRANPCEGTISSFDNEHLKSEESFHQNELAIDETREKEEGHIEDDNEDNCVPENEHGKDPQSLDAERANSCQGTIFSFDNVHVKCEQSSHRNELTTDSTEEKEESHMEDDNEASCIHENGHGKDPQFLDAERANQCEGTISSFDEHLKSEQSYHQNELTTDITEEKEEGHMEDDNEASCVHENGHGKDPQFLDAERANQCEGAISSFDGHLKSEQSYHRNELATDITEEKEVGHMEDDNEASCVHENEHVVITDKDNAERIHVDVQDKDPQSLDAEIGNLCEETISLFDDGHLKSRQSFQQIELTDDGTKEKEVGHTEDDSMTNCVQADDAAVAGFSSLSNKRIHHKLPSFNKKKEERSYRYRASQLRQGLSLDSEDFRSIQNFIESQMDGTSSSISSGSPSQGDLSQKTSNTFKNINRLERLKKMDELRDQLNRLSSQKGLEKRHHNKGLQYQPQLNSYDAERHLQSVDADSVPSSCTLESYYGHGKPPMYPPPNTFSPTHPCTKCHYGHVQTHMPYNYDAWEFNSYYQSSYAGSTILDHESVKSSYKEQKRVVRKHILRPLSGASPFTICNSCFNLVQMPSDIYLSKTKVGKVQCGQCSKVLVLSFPAVCHMDAKISNAVAQKSNKPDDIIVTKTDDAASYCAEGLTGDPVSINEQYGASFTRSISTQAGSDLAATQSSKKVSDSALHRLMGYDSASQLLRHSRVFDDGYDSFESMVPVSSRVSRRKNM